MTNQVKIFQGTYRNAPITDTVFPLVKPIQYGKKGILSNSQRQAVIKLLGKKRQRQKIHKKTGV